MDNLTGESPERLADFMQPDGWPGVILGTNPEDGDHGTVWSLLHQQGHALTFGATRSGKGVSSIIPALLQYSGSMVVIDPKGENAWASAERRRAMGQRVVILDPWDEVNRRYAGGQAVEQLTRFNPLSALKPDDLDFNDDVSAIADAMVIQTGSDPHWSDSARELIAGLVAAVVEQQPGTASLGDVRKLLAMPAKELAKIITEMVKARPDSLAASKLQRFAADGTEVASIRSTALTQTGVLDSKTLQAAMETDAPPFDLAELATGRVTLFLVLPLDRLQSHGRWLRLILTLAIRAISRQAEPPAVPVLFMLDEFGTIGRLAMVEQAFGLMAGIGIRVWGFLQDLNQLKRDYPQSWETFIANCSIMQVLNARDITTSEYFSRYIGNTTELIRSKAHEIQAKKNPNVRFMNDRIETKPAIPPETLRNLSPEMQLVFRMGVTTYLQSRYYYYSSEFLEGKYRKLPGFVTEKDIKAEKDKAHTLEIKKAIRDIIDAGYEIKFKKNIRSYFGGPEYIEVTSADKKIIAKFDDTPELIEFANGLNT